METVAAALGMFVGTVVLLALAAGLVALIYFPIARAWENQRHRRAMHAEAEGRHRLEQH